MIKLHFLWLCWGPVLVGYALGWLVRHPRDWTGPVVIIPVGLAYGAVTYALAFKRLRRAKGRKRQALVAGMIAGALLGLLIFVMLASALIG
jgi:hypothetical protein